MELKNAIGVCLISLFSATLVVLVVRALDSQTTSRLEPQLASIVEELQAIRKQGGIAASAGTAAGNDATADGLIVYYFHSNTRCPTCQAIESQANDTVHGDFASRLTSGEMTWKVLNYEQSANAQLTKKFEIQMPVVVLARMKAGQIEDWKRLDEVWALVGDKPAFAQYVRDQIAKMLTPGDQPTPTESVTTTPAIPLPPDSSDDTAERPLPIPVPQ